MLLAWRGQVTAITLSMDTNTRISADIHPRHIPNEVWSLQIIVEWILGSYPVIIMVSIPQMKMTMKRSRTPTSFRSMAVMESLNVERENTAIDKLLRITPVTNRIGTKIFHIVDTVDSDIAIITNQEMYYFSYCPVFGIHFLSREPNGII